MIIKYGKKSIVREYECGHSDHSATLIPCEDYFFIEKTVRIPNVCDSCSFANLANDIMREICYETGYCETSKRKYYCIINNKKNRRTLNALAGRLTQWNPKIST